MTFKLDLRRHQKGSWTVLTRAFPYVCSTCGKDFLNATEIVKHVKDMRKQEKESCKQ